MNESKRIAEETRRIFANRLSGPQLEEIVRDAERLPEAGLDALQKLDDLLVICIELRAQTVGMPAPEAARFLAAERSRKEIRLTVSAAVAVCGDVDAVLSSDLCGPALRAKLQDLRRRTLNAIASISDALGEVYQ